MDIFSRYSIAYKGLATGSHHYDFKVDDAFFDAFETSEIKKGKLDVEVALTKNPNMLQLQVSIAGRVMVQCDRCLGEFPMPVDYDGELIVRFSEDVRDYDGDIMWISPGEPELNLAQYIYESIVLSLPYQRIHPEDEDGASGCNKEMLDKFRIVTEEEFDKETAPRNKKMEDNPQFEKLKELKKTLE